MEIEFTDRYKAMGIPYPDLATCCDGDCEGTGVVPIFCDVGNDGGCKLRRHENDPVYIKLWEEAHKRCSMNILQRIGMFFRNWRKAMKHGFKVHWAVCFEKCDGWHFVKCPACKGTGKKLMEEKDGIK